MIKRPRWKYVVYLLMVGYVLFIGLSMGYLYRITDDGERYVRQSIEHTRVLLNLCKEMEDELPGLLTSTYMRPEDLRKQLVRQDKIQAETFGKLKDIFRGDPALLDRLGHSIEMLRRGKYDAAITFNRNVAYDQAALYLHNTLLPQLDAISLQTDAVRSAILASMDETNGFVHNRMRMITLASVVAGMLIIFITMLYDRQLEKYATDNVYTQGLLQQLANNIDDVFIVAADSQKYDYVPESIKQVLDIAPMQFCNDPQTFFGLLRDEDAAWLKDALDGEHAEHMLERDVYAPKLEKHLSINVYPMNVEAIGQKRKILVIRDQTEMMQHRQALSDALENAHATSEAKSGFLSHMSHEIRTPMNAIIGMTTIALSRIDDNARVKDCLNKISDSSRHLLGLINDVLDMSKIESGKLSICNDNFNLHQAVENISNIVRPQTQNRKQNFDILIENVDEENLVGDSMRLNQILLNILSNAMKFTPEDGLIVLKIAQIEKKNGRVRLRFTIADNGIGMSPEFLERIYKPFEQAKPNTAKKFGGTGLGMSITANLVAMMGGSINVTSKEGEGTTFFIELPFEISSQAEEEPEALEPYRILVVDDDHGTCEHAALLLEKMGQHPVWALSGEEAVRMAKEAHADGEGFEICLIDWTMPGMNGGETARAIRGAVGNDVLIIIISAYDLAAIEDEARSHGVDDFIAKPFFASTLYDMLLAATRRLNADAETEQTVPVSVGHDFSGKRVLLVEDNEFNREIGEEFLQMVNIEVDHAENGKEAVDKMTASPEGYYDMVLMDVQMPVMDGYEATRAIRASSHPSAQTIPIVAMTANAFSEDVAKAVAAGMNSHLAKPIDVNVLYRMLAQYLDRQDNDIACGQ